MEVGQEAPIARNEKRKFPDWYKPYTFNYTSDGYFLVLFFGLLGAGWTFMRDIKEQKGRKSVRVFESTLLTESQKQRKIKLGRDRVSAGDATYTRYMEPKERAAEHH